MNPTHRRRAILVAVCALLATPASAQVVDPKAEFIQAVARFSVALDGAYGDEGAVIRSSLDAMEQGLARWDGMIRAYEAAVAAEIGAAPPEQAARMHMAMGVVYLERDRVDAARLALAKARELDPNRADVHTFEGLIHSQLANDPAAATEALRRAASLDPGNHVRAYMLARQLSNLGRQEESRRLLELFQENLPPSAARGDSAQPAPFLRLGLVQEVTGVEPFFPPARYAGGFALLRQREYQQAIAEFREAAARDPLLANAEPTRRAAAAFRDGAVSVALEQLDEAAQLNPDRAEPHRLRGLVYTADGQWQSAIEAFETALRLSPESERVRLGLAHALGESGRLADAEASLRDTVQVLPASGRARYTLALLLQRQGEYPQALQEFEKTLAFGPLLGLNRIHRTIAVLKAARQDFEGAAEAYARRVDVHPNDPDAHYELGAIHLRQGQHVEALAEFAVALMLDPAHAKAHASVAQLHLRDGRYEKAVEAARRALALDPAEKENRYVLGTALLRLGRTEEGRQELQLYQQRQAEDAAELTRFLEVEALRREAAVASGSGEYEEAVVLRRKLLEYEPDSPAAHLQLGLALFDAGRFAEAVEHLEKAAARDAHFEVHRYLAKAHAALGQREESERADAAYERLKQEALRQRHRNR